MLKTLFLLLPVLVGLTTSAVMIENEALRLEFFEADGGFGLKGVVNRLAGEVRFGAAAAGRDLWVVRLSRRGTTTNEYCEVSNRSAAVSREVKRTDTGARFFWKGVDLPDDPGALDVVADVRLVPGGASEWRIQLRNRSRAWAQHTVDYPIVRKVMPEGTGTTLLPWKNLGGRLFRAYDSRKAGQHGEFNIPGTYLPLAAFMRGEAGLYFAAQDGEMRIKRLRVLMGPDVFFETPLENAGLVGGAAEGPRYAVTLAAFRGDWWDAAHRYRDWALKQKWCRKGRIAFRSDFPKNAAESDLWPNTGGDFANMTNRYRQLTKAWPDVKTAIGWSSWYAVQPGNRMNPEFFPLRDPKIPEAAKIGREKGFHLMPYVNGRIWDRSACGFAYAQAEATVDEEGRLYDEKYFNASFAVMCPYCPVWQEVVRNLGVRVLDEMGVDMVYFDQVACSRAKPCFNPAHGHPLGGGTWWADGYRRMFEAIHADFAKRGAAVTSEQLGEAWLDVIDAYLNASGMTNEDVPLFPAVYQGYCVHFGRRVGCDKPHQTRAWRFFQDAKTVLWGEAPGWIGPHIYILSHYADEAENLRTVAKFRRAHADYLVYGSLENEIRLEAPDPLVYGTVWKTADGARTAVALVNAAADERRVRYRVPGEKEIRESVLPPMRMKLEEVVR